MHLVVSSFTRQDFVSAVSNDFIDVHVHTGTLRAPNVDREVSGKFTCNQFVGRFAYSFCFDMIQSTDFAVGDGAGLFNLCHCADHFRKFVVSMVSDLVVARATNCLNTVVGFIRNF